MQDNNLSNVHCIWKSSFGSMMVLGNVAVFWINAQYGAIYSVYELLRSYSEKNMFILYISNNYLIKINYFNHTSLLGDIEFSFKLQLLVFDAEPKQKLFSNSLM